MVALTRPITEERAAVARYIATAVAVGESDATAVAVGESDETAVGESDAVHSAGMGAAMK